MLQRKVGDVVEIDIEYDPLPRDVAMPVELSNALDRDERARQAFVKGKPFAPDATPAVEITQLLPVTLVETVQPDAPVSAPSERTVVPVPPPPPPVDVNETV